MFNLKTGAKIEHKDNLGLMCIDHAVRKNKISKKTNISHFRKMIIKWLIFV
jgi:hypothetical protein